MTDLSSSPPPSSPVTLRPLPDSPAKPSRRRLASLRAIGALVLREMTTSYGRSPGGYLWAILEPVAGIALLTLVFSLMVRTPPLGINFPLFYASGIVPFSLYGSVSGAVAQSLNFSRPLLAYPSVTWVDAILARFTLNFLTQIMISYLIFSGILMFYETRVILDLPTIALATALAGIVGLGVGTLNCVLFTRFALWQRVWSILMRPMFLLSGIMFLHESIPQPWQGYLEYNPLVHIVGLMRRGFYTSYEASYVSVTYVLAVSGICGALGLLFLYRYYRELMSR